MKYFSGDFRAWLLLSICLFLGCRYLHGQVQRQNYKLQTIYVSSSKGNDNYDGLTEDKPLKTIHRALKKNKKGVNLRLKCGDVFFENISGMSNSIIESYGKGDKPVLCGFKILRNPDAWQADSIKGVWRLDLSNETDFAGYPLEYASDKLCFNDIGCIYDSRKDKIYGHLVKSKKALRNNGDFFTSSLYKRKDVAFRYLYLRYDQHPKALGNICLSTYNHGISNMNRCVIRNIVIIGFARHGICGINHTQVQNCDIDIIGGSILIGYEYWVRYGNGIECWISNNRIENNTISHCSISRTYDCGATIQGRVSNGVNPRKISFIGNKFIQCKQAFEHWLTSTDGSEIDYIDCEFTRNVCLFMGENQFGDKLPQNANLLSYDKKNNSLHIYDNVFYGASHYCGCAFANYMNDNIVYIYKGQYLNHYHGIKNYPTIYATDKASIEAYRKRTNDSSLIIILQKDSKKDKRIRKKLLKGIVYKPTKLNVNKYLL